MTTWMASSEGAGAVSRRTGVVGAVEAGGARAGHGASEDGGGPGRVDPRMPEAPGRAVGRMAGVAGVDGAEAEPCACARLP